MLGPSHHVYLEGCALTPFANLATPLGTLSVDVETVKDLQSTGLFRYMSHTVDQEEHSIEMHLPYIAKVWADRQVQVVPILVGNIKPVMIEKYARCFSRYLADTRTLFVISSDFCHWGSRFRYTRYQAEHADPFMVTSTTFDHVDPAFPIFRSIEALDVEGMAAITLNPRGSAQARETFFKYLQRTRNTICGRNPIMLLLSTLEFLEKRGMGFESRFTHYKVCFYFYAHASAK